MAYDSGLVILYAVLFALDNFVKPNKFTLMLIPVLRKGAIYSLLCVSMNLLNGFTGLFSLGQAGFILIGAYAYSIFSIPAAAHASVYQYFDGGAIQFSIPEMLGNAIGVNARKLLRRDNMHHHRRSRGGRVCGADRFARSPDSRVTILR